MRNRYFDYIIAGAGLSGLSLAKALTDSRLQDKRILLVDRELGVRNEKTWSFWHRGAPPFSDCIHKSWSRARVVSGNDVIDEPLREYTYHSIRSSRFKEKVIADLEQQPNIELMEAPIQRMYYDGTAILKTPDDTFSANYIFQSCIPPHELQEDESDYPLIQHFLGWEVTAKKNVFDPSGITLMDFDPGFKNGIAFIYILPWTETRALVEYTIFSENVEQEAFYQEKLELYLFNKFNLKRLAYTVDRKEFGVIPMQDHRYVPWYDQDILNIGAVGGLTKPSTGYTFSRIQCHTKAIVESLENGHAPALPYRSSLRYRAYDLWLLQIIHDQPKEALDIFGQLFRNNSMDSLFRFLSEENTLMQDMKTMSQVPYRPFFRAMWKTKRRLLQI